jgi:hypothetical protein
MERRGGLFLTRSGWHTQGWGGIGDRNLGDGRQPGELRNSFGPSNTNDDPVWVGEGLGLAHALVGEIEYHPGGVWTELGDPNALHHPTPDI